VILVNNELANLTYFPPGRHPGFQSQGSVPGLDVGGFSKFFLNSPNELQEIMNDQVVPFSAAVKAAKEFLACGELSKSIDWLEL
jgi:hypothetical protein